MDDLVSMSVEDLSMWLQQQGIPSEYCEKFEGNLLKRSCLVSAAVLNIDGLLSLFRKLH